MSRREEDLARAIAAAEAGAAIAMRYFGKSPSRWEKRPGALVTEADIAIDTALRAMLPRGDEGWISEESADTGERRERMWVVDPIDGTSSFAAGIPEFMVSVALVEHGRPVVGVLVVPPTGARWTAVGGRGAEHAGNRLTLGEDGAARAPVAVSPADGHRRGLLRHLPGAEVTTIGSLAHKLALVATGRFAGLVTLRRCHDWDIAAADVILAEAGALLTTATGDPLTYGTGHLTHPALVAAPPALHAELLARLRERQAG